MKLLQKLLILPLMLLVWSFFAVQTPGLVLADDITPTPTPSASPEVSPSPSPEVSPAPSASPDATPSPTPSPEVSPAPAAVDPTPTPTPSPSPEVSPSPTPVVTSSPAPSASPTPSASPSPSPTITNTASQTANTTNTANTVLQGSPIQEITNLTTGQVYNLSSGSIKFTNLPSGSNYIDFKTVSLSNGTGYQITSNMANGSFTYDLTLPLPNGATNYVVKYSATTDLSNAQVITQGITNNGNGTITIHGLNHFTVFVVDTNPASVACIGAGSNCYTSVQAAVDAASGGDTINIQSGTYNENVKVTKALTLNGVDTGSGIPSVTQIVIWSSGVSINNINTSVSDGRPSISSITNPINNGNKTNVSITGTGLANSNVSWSISDSGSAHTVSGTSTVSAGGAINITGIDVSSLNDGTLTLTVTLNDGAGHTSSATTSSSFKDTVAPATPTANITNPVNSGNVTNVSINGTDEAGATLNYSITSTGGGSAVSGSTTVNGSGNWSVSGLNLSGLGDGTLTLSVTSTDTSGNTSSAGTATATKDTVAPTITSTTVTTSNSNSSYAKAGDTITLTFTSSESINTPTVTIATHSVTASNIGGNNWRATYTMVSGDAQGLIPYTISFSDVNGNSGVTVNTNSSITFDSVAPTATVTSVTSNNANPAYAKVGDVITVAFTTSEATAFVNVDIVGDITASATNTGGNNWTFSYVFDGNDVEGLVLYGITFRDLAGNSGSVANTSSGITFDRTAPTLTSTTISSSNANSLYAKAGDVITLNFNLSETIQTPSVTISGHTVTATNISGNNWRATYTMVAGDAQGSITYSIDYQDLASNPGISLSGISSITFDSIVPVLSSFSITSNNANSSYAKVGDTITLTLTADETIQTPVVTIAGHTVTATNTSGNTWVATYVMTGTDTEGLIAYSIAFQDLASNAGTTISQNSGITFDMTAPTLTALGLSTSNTNSSYAKVGDTLTLTFTTSEAIQTPVVTIAGHSVSVVSTGGNGWMAQYTMTNTDTEGQINFTINYQDLASNPGASVNTNSAIVFDMTPPTLSAISLTSNNPNGLYAKVGNTVTLTFTSNETIQTPTVTIDGNSPTTLTNVGNVWTATYTFVGGETEGLIPYTIDFSDLAGNNGTSVSTNSTVTLDETAPANPSVSMTNPVNINNRTNVTVFVTGEAGATANYSITDGVNPAVTGSAIVGSGGTVLITGIDVSSLNDGSLGLSVTLTDAAGNTSGAGASVSTKDTVAPTLSGITASSSNSNSSYAKAGDVITLTFTSSESINAPTVTIAGHSVSATNVGNVWTATYTMVAGDAQGLIAYTIAYSDVNGNFGVTVATNSSITFDSVAPTATVTSVTTSNSNPSYAKVGDTITVNFTTSEAIQAPTVNIAAHLVTATNTSGNNWTATYVMTSSDTEGLVSYSISYLDLASNPGTFISTNSSITFDMTNPTLSGVTVLSSNSNASFAKAGDNITLNFTSSETIQTPQVSIAGHVVTATNTSGNTWTASYTMVAGDAQGLIAYTINFLDLAGNGNSVATNSAITFDSVAPTVTVTSITTSNANPSYAKTGDTITILFNSSETIQTPTVSIDAQFATVTNLGGNNWRATYTFVGTESEGMFGYAVSYQDLASNPGATIIAGSSITYDRTVPAAIVNLTTSNSNSSFAKVGDMVTLTMNASEAIQTPVVTIAGHSVVATNTSGNTWVATYLMTSSDTEGLIPYTVGLADLAGNTNSVATNSTITFDMTVPTLTSTIITSSNSNSSYAKAGDTITLTFTGSETLQTPVVTIAGHTITATNTSGNTWRATYVMVASDAQGLIAYTINFMDLASNAGVAINTNSTISFDSVAPTVSAGPNTTAHNPYTQTGTATDVSGIASITWSQVSGPATLQFDTPHALATTISTAADGTYVAKLTVTDNAGNTASSTFTLNWMVPQTTSTSSNLGSCSDGKPGSAPTLLSAIADAMGRITLNWSKAKDPVSYYLIEYGTKSGVYSFGVPNAGGSNTTSYTVGSLQDGVRYYFRVRAGNGCTPGDFSTEMSAIANNSQAFNITPANILSKFATPVLGAESNLNKNSNQVQSTEEVTPTPTSTFTPEPLFFSPLPTANPSEATITPKKVAIAVVLTLFIGSILYYLSIIKL